MGAIIVSILCIHAHRAVPALLLRDVVPHLELTLVTKLVKEKNIEHLLSSLFRGTTDIVLSAFDTHRRKCLLDLFEC